MNPCIPIVILISLFSLNLNGQEDCLKNHAFKVVVLGSSTAAGSGASRPDSAWVNRYRKYMQNLNPANEVINLAQGGYNSYRLMPTGYTPPAGRPAPDPARNISQAISREPDAIIVNLPSNDVAAGYGIEQLANLDTMVARATQAGIPIWITTTQPRNFSNQLQIQLQLLVRDSILIKYGDFAIDFWTPIVDNNNWIYPYFSSGDGVHVNDNGHRVFAKAVIETGIPYYLINANLPTDYTVKNIWPVDEILCHDRPHSFEIEITNLGAASSSQVNLEVTSNIAGYGNGGRPLVFQNTIDGLGACASDTITLTIEAHNLHNQLEVSISSGEDTLVSNNSLVYDYTIYPSPEIFPQGKKPVCYGGLQELIALSKDADSIYWYDEFSANLPVDDGERYRIINVDLPDMMWVEAVRKIFEGTKMLSTPVSTNKSWNGEMVEVVAKKDILLNEVNIPIESTGEQAMAIYFKNGSRDSFSNDPNAWTFLKEDTLQVADAGDWMSINMDEFPIGAGDTVSFYFYMSNSNARLNYVDNGQEEIIENEELVIRNSAGIAHTFGTIYSPRTFVGSFDYAYTFTHDEGCKSERKSIALDVQTPELDVDPLHILCEPDSLLLQSTPIGEGEVIWYNYEDGYEEVGRGPNLQTGIIEKTDTFYVRNEYKWPLDTSTLSVSEIWNTASNGVVFDLKNNPNSSLIALDIKPAQTGRQDILVYQMRGSSSNIRENPNRWDVPDTLSVNISAVGESVIIPRSGIFYGDTMAIYLRMADPANKILMHRADSKIEHYHLRVLSIGALDAPFSNYQANLAFAGGITYEHIAEPYRCRSMLQSVIVHLPELQLEIGPDTVYLADDTLYLEATDGFDDYYWSDGTSTNSINIVRADLDPGFTLFTLIATDSYGCIQMDSVWVYSDRSGIADVKPAKDCLLAPNPGGNYLQIQFLKMQPKLSKVSFYDARGRLCKKVLYGNGEKINTEDLHSGLYVLKVESGTEYYLKKWVKE